MLHLNLFQSPQGNAAVRKYFPEDVMFDAWLSTHIADVCRGVMGVRLDPASQVCIHGPYASTSLTTDIGIQVTFWAGYTWPANIDLSNQTLLSAIKDLLRDRIQQALEDSTLRIQVLADIFSE